MTTPDPGSRRPPVVTVDGPSGSGKSSVSRRLAVRLGSAYLDTGAMYRAATWGVLQAGADPADPAAVSTVVAGLDLQVGTDPAAPSVHVDGQPVDEAIRGEAVTAAVSAVSAVPAVRELLVARQRAVLAAGPTVAEGRDLGTVVAPWAPVKVFLTASNTERARRRAREQSRPKEVEAVQAALDRRDGLDSGRRVSPLAPARDAVQLDTTDLELDEVVERVLALCRARGLAGARP